MTGVRDALAWMTGLLDRLAIPYMVVGSFASSAHGVPRTTHDLDLVIDPTAAQLDGFLAAVDPEHMYVDDDAAKDALRRRGMFNLIDLRSGWKLDLVVRKNTAHAIEELSRRRVGTVAGVDVMIATAEDVIIAKLAWARDSASERQLADVAGIVAARGETIDRGYVERWVDLLGLRASWKRAQALAG